MSTDENKNLIIREWRENGELHQFDNNCTWVDMIDDPSNVENWCVNGVEFFNGEELRQSDNCTWVSDHDPSNVKNWCANGVEFFNGKELCHETNNPYYLFVKQKMGKVAGWLRRYFSA